MVVSLCSKYDDTNDEQSSAYATGKVIPYYQLQI